MVPLLVVVLRIRRFMSCMARGRLRQVTTPKCFVTLSTSPRSLRRSIALLRGQATEGEPSISYFVHKQQPSCRDHDIEGPEGWHLIAMPVRAWTRLKRSWRPEGPTLSARDLLFLWHLRRSFTLSRFDPCPHGHGYSMSALRA